MKKFTSLLNIKNASANSTTNNSGDGPEAEVARGVRLFCESGGPNNSGEEVLHLPVIVDAAESSPAAAKEAAQVIRKFLSRNNFMRAYVQYNAIMLVRILADNPGPTFTRNIDSKFIVTVKELLRDGRDMSVQQILRETLDTFQLQKSQDETLQPLIQMWQNEKAKWSKRSGTNVGSRLTNGTGGQPGNVHILPPAPSSGSYHHQGRHGSRSSRTLPAPHELASRIEEARTSSKLLVQLLQSTPAAEVLYNDLIKEFSDRCQSASRSIQGYINADSPAPDEETLLTLIETNDALATSLSKYQRAVLQARRTNSQTPPTVGAYQPPPGQPPAQAQQRTQSPETYGQYQSPTFNSVADEPPAAQPISARTVPQLRQPRPREPQPQQQQQQFQQQQFQQQQQPSSQAAERPQSNAQSLPSPLSPPGPPSNGSFAPHQPPQQPFQHPQYEEERAHSEDPFDDKHQTDGAAARSTTAIADAMPVGYARQQQTKQGGMEFNRQHYSNPQEGGGRRLEKRDDHNNDDNEEEEESPVQHTGYRF